MKSIKRMFGLAVLMAAIGSFFVGCALSDNQEATYNYFLLGLERQAVSADIKADDVKKGVEEFNQSAELWGIKVTDNEAGKDITQGTKATTLKKRFPVSKK